MDTLTHADDCNSTVSGKALFVEIWWWADINVGLPYRRLSVYVAQMPKAR
jgi:hypothetical protein